MVCTDNGMQRVVMYLLLWTLPETLKTYARYGAGKRCLILMSVIEKLHDESNLNIPETCLNSLDRTYAKF